MERIRRRGMGRQIRTSRLIEVKQWIAMEERLLSRNHLSSCFEYIVSGRLVISISHYAASIKPYDEFH